MTTKTKTVAWGRKKKHGFERATVRTASRNRRSQSEGERLLTMNLRKKRTETATVGESAVSSTVAPPGTAVYDEFLKEELKAQETRKSSFEQRGLAVVTTAGALVTLLFGLAALSTKAGNAKPFSAHEKVWLAVALVLFVASAIAALLTNWPLKYEGVNTDKLKERLKETPMNNADGAHRDIALTQIDVLKVAKEKNRLKGRLLVAATSLEVAAVACVGVAIFEVINP